MGLALAASACDVQFSPWAARVDGASIAKGSLNASLAAVAGNPGYVCLIGTQPIHGAGGSQSYDSRLSANILTVLVEAKAFDVETHRLGLGITPLASSVAGAEIASTLSPPTGSTCTTPGGAVYSAFAPAFRSALESLYADQAVIAAHLAGFDLTPSGVDAYSKAYPASTKLACLSVIVASARGKAAAAAAKIAAGASFASVAKTYSSDQSAANGGSLGCLAPSALPAAVATAVESLPVGQLSSPIPYQSQYLLLLVTSRPSQTSTQIAASIVQTKLSAAQKLLAAALVRARIEVDPAYGAWARTATGRAVVPSSGPSPSLLFNLPAVSPPVVPAAPAIPSGG